MNYPLVCRLISIMIATVLIGFCLSLSFGIANTAEALPHAEQRGWIIAITIAACAAAALFYPGRRASTRLFHKEAFTIIGCGWIMASLVGTLPYLLVLPNCSFTDALFESVSGLTTTGASAFDDVSQFPVSLLFWRSLSQWIGGLGVVAFLVAMLSHLGSGGKALFIREFSWKSTELGSGRIQTAVLRIIGIYSLFSVLCLIALRLCGLTWVDALTHTFTTVSTGGFSFHAASIAHFNNPAVEWVILVFMLLGAMSFFVHEALFRFDWRTVYRNSELRAYFSIIALFTILLGLLLTRSSLAVSLLGHVRGCLFQVVSVFSTTGYVSADYSYWPPAAHLLLLVGMLIGGCSGSTAGGSKVIRFLVAAKLARLHIEQAFRPRIIRPVRINGRVLDHEEGKRIIMHLVLLGLLSMLALIAVALCEPHMNLTGVFSSVIATFYNTGLGISEPGSSQVFASLQPITKLILSLLMIMGRLELYAVLVLFAPSLWRRFV